MAVTSGVAKGMGCQLSFEIDLLMRMMERVRLALSVLWVDGYRTFQ